MGGTAGTAELITTPPGGGLMAQVPSTFDRIDNPLAFIESMGKTFGFTGVCGCKNENEGRLVALACLSERVNPFELGKRYHLIDGKLSMRSDNMLAEFRARGGKHKWVEDGSDGQRATLQLIYDGQDVTVSFTMKEAKDSGLIRSGSAWVKDPAAMLRARCISRGIRMVAPEVVVGLYTPEEIEEAGHATAIPSTATAVRAPEEVEKRRRELQATATVGASAPSTPQTTATADPVIDVTPETPPFVSEPAAAVTTETTSAPTPEDHEATATLLAIEQIVTGPMKTTMAALEADLRKKNPAITTIGALPLPVMKKILGQLEAKVAAAKN